MHPTIQQNSKLKPQDRERVVCLQDREESINGRLELPGSGVQAHMMSKLAPAELLKKIGPHFTVEATGEKATVAAPHPSFYNRPTRFNGIGNEAPRVFELLGVVHQLMPQVDNWVLFFELLHSCDATLHIHRCTMIANKQQTR